MAENKQPNMYRGEHYLWAFKAEVRFLYYLVSLTFTSVALSVSGFKGGILETTAIILLFVTAIIGLTNLRSFTAELSKVEKYLVPGWQMTDELRPEDLQAKAIDRKVLEEVQIFYMNHAGAFSDILRGYIGSLSFLLFTKLL